MNTSCPQCQNSAMIAEEHLGKQVRCKKCGGTFRASCDPLDELDGVDGSPPRSSAFQSEQKRYYVRENGGPPFRGPFTLAEIQREIELGRLALRCEMLEATGQSERTLKQSTDWQLRSIPTTSHTATTEASIRRRPDAARPDTIESLLIRLIDIQEKQLHWIRAIAITVTIAFVLVFIFGMTLKVK